MSSNPSDTFPEASDSESSFPAQTRERKKGCGCLTALGIGVILLCLCVAGGVAGLRWFVLRQMPPSEVAEIQSFMSKPISFPAEWANANPYDPSLITAQENLAKAWAGHRTPILGHLGSRELNELLVSERSGRPLSEDENTSLTQLAADCDPVLEESSRTVSMAGYEVGVAQPGMIPELVIIPVLAKGASAKAHVLARNGQWDEAFDWALHPLRQAQRDPASEMMIHLTCVAAQSIGLNTLGRLAQDCPDPLILRQTLAEMDLMRARLNPDVLAFGEILDSVARLRSCARGGYPVDLAPGKPPVYYLNQAMDSRTAFPKWMVEHLPFGDPRISLYERLASGPGISRTPFLSMFGASPLGLKLLRTLLPELLLRAARPNMAEARIREQVALAKYDLVRFYLARRIAELEGPLSPAEASRSVLARLPEEPQDPFSSAPFLWDAATNRFYSVGPDRADDKLRELYDPTNGTMSRGDIAFPRKRR